MSMYASKEREALETCPYNASHRISAQRFTTHIVKCRKAHPNVEMVTCPLYAEHKVPKPELAHHVAHCSQKKEFDKQVFQEETKSSTRFEVQSQLGQIKCNEDWDTYDAPTYNPQAYCEQNRVIRQTKVESASVRKNFRFEERQRHQMLDMQERTKAKAKALEKPKPPVMSETSRREDSTTTDGLATSDIGSMSDLMSNLSTDEGPKIRYDEWTKIRGRRGRGGGKRV